MKNLNEKLKLRIDQMIEDADSPQELIDVSNKLDDMYHKFKAVEFSHSNFINDHDIDMDIDNALFDFAGDIRKVADYAKKKSQFADALAIDAKQSEKEESIYRRDVSCPARSDRI